MRCTLAIVEKDGIKWWFENYCFICMRICVPEVYDGWSLVLLANFRLVLHLVGSPPRSQHYWSFCSLSIVGRRVESRIAEVV